MKLTAVTITDEQIRELRDKLCAENPRLEDRELVAVCSEALPGSEKWYPVADWGEVRPVTAADRRDARALCADLLNARSTK